MHLQEIVKGLSKEPPKIVYPSVEDDASAPTVPESPGQSRIIRICPGSRNARYVKCPGRVLTYVLRQENRKEV